MFDDLKSAFRSLRKSPTFTAVALTVLALGIGAGTAIFSVVDAVFLRGLPYGDSGRLAAVLEQFRDSDDFGTATPQDYLDWRRQQQAFEFLSASSGLRFQFRNERDEPDDAWAQRISWELFPVLRVAPILGRAFTPEDEVPNHRVLILSYGAWQRRFGGSPDAIGATLQLNDQPWEVVGVMPPDFAYPLGLPAEMFAPLAFSERQKSREAQGRTYNLKVIGRLKPGVTLAQAHEQMNALVAALNEQYPAWGAGARVRVVALHDHEVGSMGSWMLMLLAAVGLVQLIACANVANLMLARATTRVREMAVRAALGASRLRLLRALLVESVLLSLAGAAIGIGLAQYGVDILRAWLPPNVPRVAEIAIDLRVLSAAVITAVVTGIFFGIVPAFQSSRLNLVNALKEGARSATAGASGHRLRNTLVVAEVALAVLLLVGAGLFIGSFAKLMGIDPGFDYRNVLKVNVGVPIRGGNFQDAEARGGPYAAQMIEAVRQVPGVEIAAAVSGGLPLTGSWSRSPVALPGRGALQGDGSRWEDDSVDKRIISADYLQVLRIPLIRGRYFTERDDQGAPPVVLVNEAAARKYWPGEDALGQRITIDDKEYGVVGIVGDIRHLGLETPPRQEAYLAMAQQPVIGVTLVMRTAGDPLKVFPTVKGAIWRVNPDQRISMQTLTLEENLDRLIAQRRFNMALLALFGVLGLVIAAAGIYGVMAYVVAQRTNEIGVRMALGATPSGILGMVLRRAAVLVGAGLAIGGAAAWYLSAGVRAFLFEVEPNDPRIFALAVATLTLAGLAATVVPARRAARVDPVVALRQE